MLTVIVAFDGRHACDALGKLRLSGDDGAEEQGEREHGSTNREFHEHPPLIFALQSYHAGREFDCTAVG